MNLDKMEIESKENAITVINEISKLVEDIEKKVSKSNKKAKECEEFNILKNKCCDKSPVVSISGFHGIRNLVERKILIESQTISILVSLLPSVNTYGALVSTIGDILLIDLQTQISQTGKYKSPYSIQIQHPFIIILKYSWEKSWFEIYNFILQLLQTNQDITLEHKIIFLRPIFRPVFWNSTWKGSPLQLKLFDELMLECDDDQIVDFALEALLWKDLDVHYCLFLKDFFVHLLKKNLEEWESIVIGMTPALALAIKWLMLNGHNPSSWVKLLESCLEIGPASGSAVLFILTDVIKETPSVYINPLVDVCKSIILSAHCNQYVAYKLVAESLNWFVNPSFLVNPVYKTLEDTLDFVASGTPDKWKDETFRLERNEFYRRFGCSKTEVKFAVDLILTTRSWTAKKEALLIWLKDLADSDGVEIQFRLHSLLDGIVLCEREPEVVNLCLEILLKLMEARKEIAFPLLCLLFYKLGRETDPALQMIYLFSLPKLSVRKENIPLIVGIIESLKRGSPRTMTPLVIQLYLSLWKFDRRTYSYLHKMLHDSTPSDFAWEVNVSKAIALKKICRLAPHLHAKDLVGVLSRILNECSDDVSGLPSAIAIEAVTDLCRAYVIDVAGTWNAIQAQLRTDERPKVVGSLSRFFGEFPRLNSSGEGNEKLTEDIVSMLWNYASFKDPEVVRIAFRALANFHVENLPLKLLPEVYRAEVKGPKDSDGNFRSAEDLLNLPYVPAECWIKFLEKIGDEVLEVGGQLISALLERELTSMPRGLFYLPPEKSEPPSYSYLPPRSICRCLVDLLQKRSRETPPRAPPPHVREIISLLSREYSKSLPPLDWGFLQVFMGLGRKFFRPCLALLAKQGHLSPSARLILENHFGSYEWDSDEVDETLFIFNLLPLLCKSVSYSVLQNVLERTIRLCLQTSSITGSPQFGKLLESAADTLRNDSVQPGHKRLIAKQLEKVLVLIPAESEAMQNYAKCATEFPVQSLEELTSVRDSTDVDESRFRRAVIIRSAIAMRSDIKNPLAWLSEFTEAVAHFPGEQANLLRTIRSTIRRRRSCDHRGWLRELTWRIQASITGSSGGEDLKVTLFLIDVFIIVIVTLSGCDCLFADDSKKLDVFPQALCFLFSFPDWNDMLPKVGLWLQKLLKWKHLPEDKTKAFVQALLTLREAKYLMDENESTCLFNLFSLTF